jgi:tRNA(adenine34) deaminase
MMELAIGEAETAAAMDEVPVGAVIVDAAWNVLASARNETISRCDPSAHAEMLALRLAARNMENYRLLGTTLYATVEPCVMCMGAAIHARVSRVVFGAPDPKWGACGSLYDFHLDDRFNHQPDIVGGICREQCRKLIQAFFVRKR